MFAATAALAVGAALAVEEKAHGLRMAHRYLRKMSAGAASYSFVHRRSDRLDGFSVTGIAEALSEIYAAPRTFFAQDARKMEVGSYAVSDTAVTIALANGDQELLEYCVLGDVLRLKGDATMLELVKQ